MQTAKPNIAVLIPCHNEQLSVGKVIDDFRRELPQAGIYVVDNASTDDTAKIAAEHGAAVIRELRLGKGFAIDAMFDTVRADVYVMVDGDDTYPADKVHQLIEPILESRADMVVGARLEHPGQGSFRPLHVWGNNLVRRLVNWVGRASLTDIMSGYRAFGGRVIRRLPTLSRGFEAEVDMTIQMLYYRMRVVEVPVPYRARPAGSVSKLRTFPDGARVLWKIFSLFSSFKPLTCFGSLGVVLLLLGALAGAAPVADYLGRPDHFVTHVPLAVLAAGLVILAGASVGLGILLHMVNWRLLEMHSVLTRRDTAGNDK
jgi:glycosyltransferase involved in cell wall biosynthesis